MILDYLQLLSSDPIFLEGVGHVVPPTIRSVQKIGLKSYQIRLGVLQITIDDIKKENLIDGTPVAAVPDITIFDVICSDKNFIQLLIDSFSFFILETVEYNEKKQSFDCRDSATQKIIGAIDKSNFGDICSLILQLNFLETSSGEQLRPKNKAAERIFKKIQSMAKNNSKENAQSIGEIVAAICSNIDTYRYSDIWALTVYQLYDLFFRLKLKKQTDIIALRWAAWGKDPFDFDLWCKNIRN